MVESIPCKTAPATNPLLGVDLALGSAASASVTLVAVCHDAVMSDEALIDGGKRSVHVCAGNYPFSLGVDLALGSAGFGLRNPRSSVSR